jgi:phosphocarrier protein HPr
MIETQVTLSNKLGLHARASAKLVAIASRYQCQIELCRDTKTINAKSIMGVMMLAASNGTTLTLKVNGPDEENASEAINSLINNKFGENE